MAVGAVLDRARPLHVAADGLAVAGRYALLCSALKAEDVDCSWHELGANSFF
jgi:hypothetical protein